MNFLITFSLHISLIILPLFSYSQETLAEIKGKQRRDSIFLDHANTYINKKLGSEFVKKNLKFTHLYYPSLSIAVYETQTSKNLEGRNTLIVYFKNMTYEVDTVLTILSKDQILKSICSDSTCTLYIGIEKATEIAKASGLKEGIEPWTININLGPKQKIPKWSFDATYTYRPGGYYSGAEVNINMTDGKYTMSNWSQEP